MSWLHRVWRPAAFTPSDMILLALLCVVPPTLRGMDYLTGRDVTVVTDISSLSLPLAVWGWMFLGSAAVLMWGVVSRCHLGVFIGHVLLAVVYGAHLAGLALFYLVAWHPDEGHDRWIAVTLAACWVAGLVAAWVGRTRRAVAVPLLLLAWVTIGWFGSELDGVRTVNPLIMSLALNIMLAVRGGAVPLNDSDTSVQPLDSVVGDEGQL